jgi:hypothetical protein
LLPQQFRRLGDIRRYPCATAPALLETLNLDSGLKALINCTAVLLIPQHRHH